MLIKSITNINTLISRKRYLTKLAFVSDLHLEHRKWECNYPKFNYSCLNKIDDSVHGLAIVGDLSNPYYDNFTLFLAYCGTIFKNVYYVAGNHEYYNKGFCKNTTKNTLDNRINSSIEDAKYMSDNNSIYYLNNSHVQLNNNKIIIGSTLWSDHSRSLIPNHNSYIKTFYQFINEEHYKCCNFLKRELDACKAFNKINFIDESNVTILTHYLPTYQLIDKKYHKIHYTDKAKSERYFSNIEYFIKPPVKNWICGHSHSVIHTNLNGVYLGINSYVSQKSNLVNLKFVNL